MSKSKKVIEIQYATFMERLKAAIMDYGGPWTLFFVGGFLQSGLFGIGIAGPILGVVMGILGIIALLLINGYAPALNRGFTPNKMNKGVRLMKIVDKNTMELREINEGDMAILLVRAFFGWFEILLFLPIIPGILVAIIMSTNDKNQRLADMIAGTVIIKVDPVEKVNIKDFRMKKSDPPPTFDGMKAADAGKAGKESIAATPSKKAGTKVEKIDNDSVFTNSSLMAAGKWIFIGSAIYLILAQIVNLVAYILGLVNFSFLIFGGVEPIENTGWGLNNVTTIISYVVLFICCAGFILYYIGIKNKTIKLNLVLSASFFLLFIIFLIVQREANWQNFKPYLNLDYSVEFGTNYIIVKSYGSFTMRILYSVFLILSLIFLSKFVRSFNEEYQTNIGRFFGQISLIVFFTLLFTSNIIGIATDPLVTTTIFDTVIFYLTQLCNFWLIFVYIGIYSSLIRLRKIANVTIIE